MKLLKNITATALALAVLAGPLAAFGGDTKPDPKAKPYPLTTCVVSGDKLGEMGDPYVYKYKDREIHFCCKGCVKDFNKEPAKYLKKLDEAEAKAAKKSQS